MIRRAFSICNALTAFWLIALVNAPVVADTQPQKLAAQREQYELLRDRIRTAPASRLSGLQDDIQAMADYPLHAYLRYELINRQISYRYRSKIRTFLQDTKGLPIRNQILKKWLRYLAENHYQTVFLQEYEPGLGTELLCRQLHFSRRKHGADAAWHEQVAVIWLSGSSQPEACDPVIYYWRLNGQLTPELAIQRIGLAGASQQTKLTRYLRRFAPRKAQYLADRWVKAHRNPAAFLSPKSLPFRYPEQEQKLAHWALNKASWRWAEKVANALPKWQASGKLSPEIIQDIAETLAISLTLDNHPLAQSWLDHAATDTGSKSVWRWNLAYAIRAQNWLQVLRVVERAPMHSRYSSEFRYWQARALAATGQTEQAKLLRDVLSNERHYYGFMASAQLGVPATLNVTPIEQHPDVIQQVASMPAVQRAKELHHHTQYTQARREWYALNKLLTKPQQRAGVILAHQWGWHDQAIVGALRTGDNNALQQRFPLAHVEPLQQQAEHYQIDPAFALAIARRESSFMLDAVSTAGASGLMQLMPNTAKYLARSTDILPTATRETLASGNTRRLLFQPELNMQLGMGYLRYLHGKMQKNPVLVTAAYNAGWQKVQSWVPSEAGIPIDIWIDTIPFKETRDYVKAVLAYQVIYEWQLGQKSSLFSQLQNMQTPVLKKALIKR